jgi:hypothetical protein
MSGWSAEVGQDGRVHLYQRADEAVLVHDDLDPDEAWDLGDDLLIAADRVWGGDGPSGGWLDDGAARQLFTDEQLDALKHLADERGVTVPQLIREEMIATVEFSRWAETLHDDLPDVYVAKDAEGEDGDPDADPPVEEPEPDAEAVHDAHGGGDQVQNDLDETHGRPTPPTGGVMAW